MLNNIGIRPAAQGVLGFPQTAVPGGLVYADTPVLYVDSAAVNASDGNSGLDPSAPLATLAGAVAAAAVDSVIYVSPTHAETITGVGALTIGKAGLSIIGIGNGSRRPTIKIGGTTTTIAVTAAGVTFRNLRLTADIDEVVKIFNITGAYCALEDLEYFETASNKNLISFALIAAADCAVRRCRFFQANAPAANGKWLELVGADRVELSDNLVLITTTSNAASNAIGGTTTASINVLIVRNNIVQLGGTATVPIALLTNTTGLVAYNNVASLKTAIAGSIALASAYGAQNFAAHVVNKNGLLEPVVDA